ncbi:MAG: hypothetical protein ACM3XN_07600 [Chloroflexota bacterium]
MSRRIQKMMCVLSVAFLLIATTAGCAEVAPQTPQADNGPTVEPIATEPDNPVQYYFLNGLLMGSYENGEWHSLCGDVGVTPYYVKDILAQEEYRLYGDGAPLGVVHTIGLNTGNGLGGFERDMTGTLAPYGKLLHDGASVGFQLPTKLGPDLNNLEVPNYGFYIEFTEDHLNPPPLATNSDANPFTREMTEKAQVTEACAHTLAGLLAENGLANMEPNVSSSIRGDFDGDGKEELLVVATTPRDEFGWLMVIGRSPEVKGGIGTYSVVLYEDDDSGVQILFSDLRPYVGEGVPYVYGESKTDVRICQHVELFETADLNGDGQYEICVRQHYWESGRFLIFAIGADGEYKLVMQSDYGM